ncbi:MAG: hypothetical protein R6U95_07115 [Bacteroidales bacterium]
MKKIYWVLLFVGFFLFKSPYFSQAQSDWVRYRYEIIGGIGPTFFLGELGGNDGIGQNNILDLDWGATRVGGHVGMRYFVQQRLAVQASFTFGFIHGSDKNTNEFYRNYRDISFRSPIYELHGRIEYKIRKERPGHRYDLKGVRGRRAVKLVTYAFVGVGVFYFNPQAQIDGSWINLQPIGTEGQNFMKTRKPYSRVAMSIPCGFQFKYLANRYWAFSFEVGPRFLFTDYLDDVSTTYASPDKIAEHQNRVPDYVAKLLADPAYESNIRPSTGGGLTYGYYNEQRGDPYDNDFYMFAMISVHYKLKAKRNGWPTFQK